jgi:hypothetical protein
MKKLSHVGFTLLAAFLLVQAVMAQQIKNPVSTVVREILPRQQKNLTAAVEEMPASKFDFKPTPEQMSFGHLVIHITHSNYELCSLLAELPPHKAFDPTGKEGKDELVAALKDSFDYCGRAVAAMDDSSRAITENQSRAPGQLLR